MMYFQSRMSQENESPVFQIRFPSWNLFFYTYIYIRNQKEGYRKNNGRGNLDLVCQISFPFFFFNSHVLFTFFDDETKKTYSFVKCLGTPRYVSLIQNIN